MRTIVLTVSAVLVAALSLPASQATACTAAQVQRGAHRLVVKSFDWHDGSGFVMVNPKGTQKTAVHLDRRERALSWHAKHASVTLNQHGPQMPLSGMNDAGLVVETLWLRSTEYPSRDDRPAVNELQLVQWLLDSFGTTKHALAELPRVRVAPIKASVHWFICDRAGDCATIEYLDGRLVTHSGASLPDKVLTNHPYGDDGGLLGRLRKNGSQRRFERACTLADADGVSGPLPKRGQSLLDDVRSGRTRWQIIWDPSGLTATFTTRPGRTGARTRRVALAAVKARCSDGPLVLNLESRLVGDVSQRLAPIDPVVMTRQVTATLRRLAMPRAARTAAHVMARNTALRCLQVARSNR